MSPDVLIAVCATVVAVASLVVSITEARATRRHHRQSVRPILQLDASWRPGRASGIRLSNVGLGPARITTTSLTLDGTPLGPFDEATVNGVRDLLAIRPHAVTLGGQPFLDTGYDRYLLGVEDYHPDRHGELVHLVRDRLDLSIGYQSLYGEAFVTDLHPQR